MRERVSHQEWVEWGVYYARKNQRAELEWLKAR